MPVRCTGGWGSPTGRTATGGGGLTAFLYQATEPILAPIRRLIPPTAGIDWAPMIAILLLGVVTRVLL